MQTELRKDLAFVMSLVITMSCMQAFADGWSGKEATVRVTHWSDRTVIVANLAGVWSNPDACDDSKVIVLTPELAGSEESYTETYATLLSAHLAGRKINAFLSGCEFVGNKTFPVITQIAVF